MTSKKQKIESLLEMSKPDYRLLFDEYSDFTQEEGESYLNHLNTSMESLHEDVDNI